MDGFIHRRDRTIYVNNIVPGSTEDDLFSLFSRAGPIEKVIFKNFDGIPQHALIVFRRLESVMFCLDNNDYFKLKGEMLGIRALRESRHTQKQPGVPRSAGYECQKDSNVFNFDMASVESFRQRSSESESLYSPSPSESWKSMSPNENPDFNMMPPPPPPRRFRPPPPLNMPPAQSTWSYSNRDFGQPPFSAGMINSTRPMFTFNQLNAPLTESPSWEEFRDMQSPKNFGTSDNLFAGLSPITSIPDAYSNNAEDNLSTFLGFANTLPSNSFTFDHIGGNQL